MKKIFLLTILAVLTFGTVNSYGQEYKFRPKYNNFSFAAQTLTVDGVKSNARGMGFAYTSGRSYIVHPGAIAKMLRFGIDATWGDINYAKHSEAGFNRHQVEVGVGIGASVHVNPVSQLGIHAYFRFMPSFSGIIERRSELTGNEVYGNYASFFVAGGAVSWGIISIGAEARWGKATYYQFNLKEGETDYKPAIKTNGLRAYVSLRF